MANAYISDFEALREWFMEAKTSKFTIAHGSDFSSRRYAFNQDDALMEQEDAWDLLEEKLRLLGANGGSFVINLPTKNGGNGWKMVFKLASPASGDRRAGIGNTGSGTYIGEKRVEDYIAEKINDKMENFELRRRVEDLEAEIESQGSFVERLVNRITEHPNFDPTALADKLVAGIGAILGNKSASVGLSGFPAGSQPEKPVGQQSPRTEEELEATGQAIGEALERIAMAFPDLDLGELLTGLAAYIEENPSMARMLVNQILKK